MTDQRQPPLLKLNRVGLTTPTGLRPLLQEISLTVAEGERVAIVGPTGAGKTSLLRLLNRLCEPTAGKIELAGKLLNQIPPIQLRRQIVLVPQEPKLLGMAAQETLTYPLRLQQLPPPEIQQRLQQWQRRLRIPKDWLERQEWQISLGQRQLLSIARALIMQPPILLLDEPTSALDAGSANFLVGILIELAEQEKTTMLMVSHQLDIARQFAQRVLYLEQGQLLADSSTAQLDWAQIRENLAHAEADKIVNSEF
jgi:D-methionine transport system ATP-binding protein